MQWDVVRFTVQVVGNTNIEAYCSHKQSVCYSIMKSDSVFRFDGCFALRIMGPMWGEPTDSPHKGPMHSFDVTSCVPPNIAPTNHYYDAIMGAIASQITSLTIVYSTVYSDADQSKHQSSASLAFVREIHRGPVNFPHKWPVTRKMFPFDDVIMSGQVYPVTSIQRHCKSKCSRDKMICTVKPLI